jgi:hypothetical protein
MDDDCQKLAPLVQGGARSIGGESTSHKQKPVPADPRTGFFVSQN